MVELESICPTCGNNIDFSKYAPFSTIKCEKCSTGLIIPVILGHFQLTNKLKEDNLFEIYEGYDTKIDKNVLLITLKKDIDDYDEWLQTCKSEATALMTLQDPSIISILNYGITQNTFFLAYPLVNSFDLTEYDPNKVGELDANSVIAFMKKIAHILEIGHFKEFEFHNLCPENIIIDSDGNIILQNYFYNRLRYLYESSKKIKFSVSPYYISPEKAEKNCEEKKGDVFSFGVLFYYFLTGKYPFDGKNDTEIIFSRVKRKSLQETQKTDQVKYTIPTPITDLRSDISIKLGEIIMTLLLPYPVQRPTFAEFLDAIKLLEAEKDKEKISNARIQLLDAADTQSIPTMKTFKK